MRHSILRFSIAFAAGITVACVANAQRINAWGYCLGAAPCSTFGACGPNATATTSCYTCQLTYDDDQCEFALTSDCYMHGPSPNCGTKFVGTCTGPNSACGITGASGLCQVELCTTW